MIAVASLTCGLVHAVGPEISQHHVSHDELAQGWLARARWDSNSFASGVHAPQRLVVGAGSIRCPADVVEQAGKRFIEQRLNQGGVATRRRGRPA
jgi:transposase